MAKDNILKQLIGKTIKGIVVNKHDSDMPHCQVFLVFTDDTYYEFYGDLITFTGRVDKGNKDVVMRYAEGHKGSIATAMF